ncbi:unnamed protein product [Parascedosporium putredinis]|uniref:Choline dehydrogenase n=1 Tax=Parascedosporium putredinis TaxID=1442378 RepID=A0A9P1H4P9_9PEZI|nr:unnamed protein product [Parascedosporium putredinis]CAI7996880.1 unnamed protein product [Parascedosporium putredinis]
MRHSFLSGLLAAPLTVQAVALTGYEYIVVGSGAGGGPLAARLALAGHKTLLIEAGDDYHTTNYTVPAYSANSSEDPEISWNFFVRHYADDARQARDYKTTYDTPDGHEYTGLNPPEGSTIKGTLYPRTQAIGGCTAHNALIAVYPHQSDFEYIASLTGDDSWSPRTCANRAPEHPLGDPQLLSVLGGAAVALTDITGTLANLETLIAGDANADSVSRDKEPGYYQIPLSTREASRIGPREFILAVRDATYENGTKMYPLDVRTNAFVTKVVFDDGDEEQQQLPRATGVEFLDGKHLATASREVIVAGGVYNSPQLLKLSGVGPADELTKFGIPVVADLPGVGTNLQDHYEISVQGRAPANFSALDDCTFSLYTDEDPCLDRWNNPILGDHGIYSSSGLAATMFYKSNASDNGDFDIFAFGGPVNFRGYFPKYAVNATVEHDWFSWAILKAHPRNTAGTAMYEAVELARKAFASQLVPITEVLPGAEVTSQEDIETYVKDTAWGHHASSTCPIGADDDPLAVLDSSFRVRGVQGLRVVDASVYPRIPGTFTAVSTFLVAEKAADVILGELYE